MCHGQTKETGQHYTLLLKTKLLCNQSHHLKKIVMYAKYLWYSNKKQM